MIHIGIDLHSRNMTLVALNDNGDLCCEVKTKSNPAGLARFFGRFSQPVQAAVECTSYWYWVADWCSGHNIPLQLAHAKMLKAISYAKVKTDSVDARTLADLLRAGLIPQAYKTEGNQRDLRELTRARLRMIERLEGFLMQSLPKIVHLEAHLLLSQIRQTQDHIMALEDAIQQQVDFHRDVDRLLMVPGFGLVVSWTILAEVGDISRFSSPKQFTSCCRLVPGAKDSGGTRRHRSKNKDGNRYLRIAFNQAAIVAYTHYPVVRKFYKKITRRSGKHVARTVVGKELAKGVWHMLTKNEPYKGFKGTMTKISSENYWPQPISSSA